MAEKAGVFEEIPSGHRETGTDPAAFPSHLWPWRRGASGSSRLCIYESDTPAKHPHDHPRLGLQPRFHHLITSPRFPPHPRSLGTWLLPASLSC